MRALPSRVIEAFVRLAMEELGLCRLSRRRRGDKADLSSDPFKQGEGEQRPPSLTSRLFFLLSLSIFEPRDAASVYWSMSALLIARQPEEPSASIMVTVTGLRLTAARLTFC